MMPDVNQGTQLGQALNEVLFLSRSICSSNQGLDSDVMSFYCVSTSQHDFYGTMWTILKLGH